MGETNLVVDGQQEQKIAEDIINFFENSWAGRQSTLKDRLNRKLFKELKHNGNNVAFEIVEDKYADRVEELLRTAKLGYCKNHTDKGTIFMVAAENDMKLQSILNIEASERGDVSRHFTSNTITELASYDKRFEFLCLDLPDDLDDISDIRIYQHGLTANTDGKKVRIPGTYLFSTGEYHNGNGNDFGTYLIDMASQMAGKTFDPQYIEDKKRQIAYDKAETNKFVDALLKGQDGIFLGNAADKIGRDGFLETIRDKDGNYILKFEYRGATETFDVSHFNREELRNKVQYFAEKINNMKFHDAESRAKFLPSERPAFKDSRYHDFLKSSFAPYVTKTSFDISLNLQGYEMRKSGYQLSLMEADKIIYRLKHIPNEEDKKLKEDFLKFGFTENDWDTFVEEIEDNTEVLKNSCKVKTAKQIAAEIEQEKAFGDYNDSEKVI